jgi:hypothetical protein
MNPYIAKLLNIDLKCPGSIDHVSDYSEQYTTTGEPIKKYIQRQGVIKKNMTLRGWRNRIEFQNIGETNAKHRNWTILALGGQYVLESKNDTDLYTDDITITFPDDPLNANGKNELQYVEYVLQDSNVSRYQN